MLARFPTHSLAYQIYSHPNSLHANYNIKFFHPPPSTITTFVSCEAKHDTSVIHRRLSASSWGRQLLRERKGGWDDFLAMLNKLFLSSFRCDKHYFPISWCGFYCSCCFMSSSPTLAILHLPLPIFIPDSELNSLEIWANPSAKKFTTTNFIYARSTVIKLHSRVSLLLMVILRLLSPHTVAYT